MSPDTTRDPLALVGPAVTMTWRVLRGLLSLVGAALVAMASIAVWGFTESYAVHFCKWPATISCDAGSTIWWLVPTGLVVVSLVGALGLAWWTYFGEHGRQAWLLVAWVVGFPFRAVDRSFGLDSLVFYAVYVPVGTLLLARMGGAWFPQQRRVLGGVALALSLGYLALLAYLPSHLEGLADR